MKKFYSMILMAVVALTGVTANAADWYVSGAGAILNGKTWDHSAAENKMVQQTDGTYKLEVKNCTLEVGASYEWLVTDGSNWIKTEGNDKGSNFVLTVTETAKYTVTYTFDGIETASASVTKTGSAGEVTHTYSVAGNNADIFGASWDPSNTATDMTKGSDGVYSWTSASFSVSDADLDIAFKVVEDHAWGQAWPSSDYHIVAPVGGPYTLTITFNHSSKEVKATIGGEVTHSYSVAGCFNEDEGESDPVFVTKWDAGQTATNMTKGSDGTYSWTSAAFTAEAEGEIRFKVVEDHNWAAAYPADNYVVTVPAGSHTLTVNFNANTKEITASLANSGVNDINADKAVAGVKYYNLLGVESREPFAGMNVVVTTYTDGSKSAKKVVK